MSAVVVLRLDSSLSHEKLKGRKEHHVEHLAVYLEDHPMTCKWLITMVSCCPLSRFSLVINPPLTNHSLSGMILQLTAVDG